MCDFDITSFRDKPNTKNKSDSLKEESAYATFLKKRKLLGLESDSDDSDTDSNQDEVISKRQKQQQQQLQQLAKSTIPNTPEVDQKAANLKQSSDQSNDSQETDDEKQLCQPPSHTDTKLPIPVADDPICLDSDDKIEKTMAPSTRQPTKPAYTITLDIEDLDPELASLAVDDTSLSSTSVNAPPKHEIVPQKIQIKVYYISLMETVDPVIQGVIDALSKPVKIIMLDNNRFDTLLTQYCRKKRLLMQDMVLVYDNVPVVLRATPSSLSMSTESINRMEVYKKEDYQKKMNLEQEIRAARLSQLNDLTSNNDQDDDFDDDDLNFSSNTQTQQEDLLHIKLRGKDNKDIGLRVKQTTTMENIVKEYHRIMGLDASLLGKIQLSFEGETLTKSMTIADTELEDEDMVSVVIHS